MSISYNDYMGGFIVFRPRMIKRHCKVDLGIEGWI